MGMQSSILPLRGRWQREALTEGAPLQSGSRFCKGAPTTALQAVPLPRWGRIL